MSNEQFYMVWNPNCGVPHAKHATHAEAKAEADRLAEKQPGDTFYILRSRCAITVEKKPDLAAAHRRMLAADVAAKAARAAYRTAEAAAEKAWIKLHRSQSELDDATRAFVGAGRA